MACGTSSKPWLRENTLRVVSGEIVGASTQTVIGVGWGSEKLRDFTSLEGEGEIGDSTGRMSGPFVPFAVFFDPTINGFGVFYTSDVGFVGPGDLVLRTQGTELDAAGADIATEVIIGGPDKLAQWNNVPEGFALVPGQVVEVLGRLAESVEWVPALPDTTNTWEKC